MIGVYEAAIIVVDGRARQTSRAAEPEFASADGQRYHRSCYLEASGPPPEPESIGVDELKRRESINENERLRAVVADLKGSDHG